jgi:two-component system OmpR family response regulator
MELSLPSSHRLLYVEDDADLRHRVTTYLEGHGFGIVEVASLAEARSMLHAHHFDAVLLDLVLDHEDGSALLREVARRGRPAVVITSARIEEADRILAIEAGADDYLVKPFSLRELVARLRSVVRRTSADRLPRPGRRTAHVDSWTIDLAAHKAQSADRVVELTGGEVAILRALIERPQHVFTRTELLASTRHDDGEVFDRTVDVLISRLRRKLEDDPLHPTLIQTVRGEGYYFAREVAWQTHN